MYLHHDRDSHGYAWGGDQGQEMGLAACTCVAVGTGTSCECVLGGHTDFQDQGTCGGGNGVGLKLLVFECETCRTLGDENCRETGAAELAFGFLGDESFWCHLWSRPLGSAMVNT